MISSENNELQNKMIMFFKKKNLVSLASENKMIKGDALRGDDQQCL